MNARVIQLYDEREQELMRLIEHLEWEAMKAQNDLHDALKELDEYRKNRPVYLGKVPF